AVAAFLPSDHFMAKATEFRRVLKKAFALAQKNQNTVLLGLRPTYPETGYGYIKIKSKSRVTLGQDYPVSQFVEKPNLKTAEKYVLSGNYFWNAGIFIWEIKTLLGLFQKHQPEIYQGLLEIQKNPQNLRLTFQNFPNISIDYALAERAKNIRVIPADLGWSDIGHFGALQAISPNDPNSNVVRGRHLGLDTKNSLIHGLNRLIVTIGLENMIVVDEKDALLICPVNRAQDVKKIVEQLKKEGRQEYL
ncbi:mannose-1-phosphate guanylyltransferase, partial [Candidatus Berkelbacteria bacterium]|nr:mannose-1-phosphate guanylyltransferase [Candidatus Berkelbacteria bacterium]